MTLDVRGSLKNTRKSKNRLVVIDELLANSIDAFLIRQSESKEKLSLDVSLSIKANASNLLEDEYDLEIECKDNGCGLGPEQLKAFLTKDTSYKDDLKISGIGNCKGSGRVQFFHHFSILSVSSIYPICNGRMHVYLSPKPDRKTIEETDFRFEERDTGDIGTAVTISGVLPKIRSSLFTFSNINKWMHADALKQYVLFNLLQRFVSLKDVLGDFRIRFSSDLERVSKAVLQPSDIPPHTRSAPIEVKHVEGDQEINADLTVTHYKLDAKTYNLPQNIVALCAKSAIAENITKRYLKSTKLINNAIDGFFHIILVEGVILDHGVNEQRDGFDKIPADNDEGDLFGEIQITFEDIYTVLDDIVEKLLTPPDWSRAEIVAAVGASFGVSEEMLTHSSTRVGFGDTATSVARRALRNLQDKVVDETVNLLAMKKAIEDLEPDSDDFRRRINDLSWQFTASLKTVDMANLSQLVVRRSNLIDVLDLAVRDCLKVQTDRPNDERRRNEALIHNIFFPMRKDSDEVAEHDVWLLSEEYHYYDYIASDKPLSQLKWGGEPLFDNDIDDEINSHLERISDENKAVRPDIALFHEEGSVVIVEFKAPGVSLDEHDNDLTEYANIIAAKSKRRFSRFYGYLIGDTINTARLRNYKPLPGGQGWFDTSTLREPKTQYGIGQLYSELLMYEDVVDRARKRIGVYRERLGLPSS
ncbi:hypothetical protein ACGYLV_04310 [Sulfitobacter sp. M21595]|uniref:hypothetical protein n=1 Tax=Sulfitobacter sp. M21595 TaxID=3368574 RepID=UPI003747574B